MHTFSFSFSLYPPLLTQTVCLCLLLSLPPSFSLSALFTVITCILFPFPLYLLICVIFPDFPLDLPSTAHLLNLSFSFYPLPCSLSLSSYLIYLTLFLIAAPPISSCLTFFLSLFLSLRFALYRPSS